MKWEATVTYKKVIQGKLRDRAIVAAPLVVMIAIVSINMLYRTNSMTILFQMVTFLVMFDILFLLSCWTVYTKTKESANDMRIHYELTDSEIYMRVGDISSHIGLASTQVIREGYPIMMLKKRGMNCKMALYFDSEDEYGKVLETLKGDIRIDDEEK